MSKPRFARSDFLKGYSRDGDEAGLYWQDFITALQLWSIMQAGPTSVRDAATTFSVSDALIRQAVAEHYWMAVIGPDDDPTKQIIKHEGE